MELKSNERKKAQKKLHTFFFDAAITSHINQCVKIHVENFRKLATRIGLNKFIIIIIISFILFFPFFWQIL